MEHLEQSQRTWKRDWTNWRSKVELRSPRPQHYCDLLEYLEESWKFEETCYYSDFSNCLREKFVKRWIIKITTCNLCARYSHQRIGTGTGGFGNMRTSGNYPSNIIVEIGQNTKKSPRDLCRFAVTQTQVENYLLTLVWKTLKWVK